MELVEGDDLSRHIARGPIPVDEALLIARQIAQALEAAHEKGIVHRDLKPANIKVTPGGDVKVLDFGLAKAFGPDGADASVAAMNSPTLTARATEAGLILGTAAYMAPEQARGKAVDKRADIWAFGAVLYEMLTGKRAFEGETISDTLAAVLKTDPDWSKLPADTPRRVTRLLERCLTRTAADRLRDIGEARIALEQGDEDTDRPAAGAETGRRAGPRVAPWRRAMPWALAALFAMAALAAWLTRPSAARPASYALAIAPPQDRQFEVGSNSGNVTISPDGSAVAFVASASGSAAPALWVRSLSADDARPLPGTSGVSYPFWSPDGRQLGFFADGKLKTVDLAGGLPTVVADAPNGRGGSWCDDGQILFSPVGGGAVSRVPAKGGTVAALTKLDASRGENAHYWPVCLPGSQKFLYFVRSAQPDNSGIYLSRVDGTGTPVRLVSALSSGIYAPSAQGGPGYLLWARDTDLYAQPLDVTAGELRGEARKIAGGVQVEESQRQLMAGASATGVLVWATERAALRRFALYDRSGRRLGALPLAPGKFMQPAFSPDGTRVNFTRTENGSADIWTYDVAGGATRRVTSAPGFDEGATWSPDGRSLAYVADESAVAMRLDGSAPSVTLGAGLEDIGGWTPDGRIVVASADHPRTGWDLEAVALDRPNRIVPLDPHPGDEFPFAFSPDGRWLAFNSNQTGRDEVYVARFDDSGAEPRLGAERILVSDKGGDGLLWRRDGREILYLSLDGQIMSVPVTPGRDAVVVGQPTPLFNLSATPANTNYVAASPDGSRFVIVEFPYAAGQTLQVLTDWRSRLR